MYIGIKKRDTLKGVKLVQTNYQKLSISTTNGS
jgi:hypothetical protein